jgi:hypothetical protein
MKKIIVIENILHKSERVDLINKSKKMLIDGEELRKKYSLLFYPGKQTDPNLHLLEEFKIFHKKILRKIKEKSDLDFQIKKSWVNFSNGSDVCWHDHNCNYALVYYAKTIPFINNGTIFKDNIKVNVKQNSMLLFPGSLVHSAPKFKIPFDRYTLAMELDFFRSYK